jgi:hypothetical protein
MLLAVAAGMDPVDLAATLAESPDALTGTADRPLGA